MVLQPLDVELGPQRLVEADVGELGGAVVDQLVSATMTSQFCEIVAIFFTVLSKRGRFSKAPSLETSDFSCRGPRVSTIGFYCRLCYFDFYSAK